MGEIDPAAARNPYAPPKATVADGIPSGARKPRPATVFWAVALFWLDLVLSVGQFFLQTQRPVDLPGWIGHAVTWVLLAFNAWVIYRISTGRNWARWVALVSVIFRILISIPTIGQIVTASTDELDTVGNALSVVALVLLFVSPGRRWFRTPAEG